MHAHSIPASELPLFSIPATQRTVPALLRLRAERMGSGDFSIVGMGALVATATGAPITGILIVFEMTNDYEIVLPLMLSTVIANVVAQVLSGHPVVVTSFDEWRAAARDLIVRRIRPEYLANF